MIPPEVQGALIGVGATGLSWTGKIAFDYLRLKFSKNGNSNNGFCSQHREVITLLREIKSHYEEEKQIELYTEAIKRAGNII